MDDLIIVGSGPAGTWAAWQAVRRGLKPLILDAGMLPGPEAPLRDNYYDLRRQDPDQASYLLGAGFESLRNLHQPYASPKVKAPRFRYVTARSQELGPTVDEGFRATQSFARGGLAEAWGASVQRFDDEDLRAFPFKARDLDPYYEALTREIGVSGAQDDLSAASGWQEGLQPPLEPDRLAAALLAGYGARRAAFQRRGIRVGRPQMALLSEKLGPREACAYDNLAFWQPGLPAIYSPSMTLESLQRRSQVHYQGGWLVERFKQQDG